MVDSSNRRLNQVVTYNDYNSGQGDADYTGQRNDDVKQLTDIFYGFFKILLEVLLRAVGGRNTFVTDTMRLPVLRDVCRYVQDVGYVVTT